MNGYIWVGKPRKAIAELDLDAIYSSKLDETSRTDREQIIRTCCVIRCLDTIFRNIDDSSISEMYQRIKDIPLKNLGSFNPNDVFVSQ